MPADPIRLRSCAAFGSPNERSEASVRRGFLWIGTPKGGVWIGGPKTLLAIADAIYEAHDQEAPDAR